MNCYADFAVDGSGAGTHRGLTPRFPAVIVAVMALGEPRTRPRAGAAVAALLLLAGGACSPVNLAAPPTQGPAVPTARLGAAVAANADPRHSHILLFGGRTRSQVEGDTWIWQGGWQRVSPKVSPPPRSFAGVAPDGRGGVILFGGDPSDPVGPHDDTWRWNGTTWTQLHPRTVPDDGAFRTMGTGPDGAPVLVVFAADRSVRTWTWVASASGGDWRAAGGSSAPPWRDDAGLVPDHAAGRMLMFGGIPPDHGTQAADTWAWDGSAWTELHPTHRPGGGPVAVADLAGGPLVVEQDGTWTWNGSDWVQAQGAGVPPWQPYAGLAAVPGASQGEVLAVLLTGPAGEQGQTWRWNGFGWTQA